MNGKNQLNDLQENIINSANNESVTLKKWMLNEQI